ncbi:heme exporter protein CcmD [Maricaulis sp.]|uniref:heme exporter protein CcmD n=1 Tax=Maricaulis sp. TaxID=1486257 RepID=UPI00261F10E2|nr:heme exporter protein CcmD [Maricaulis sp.]
MQDFLNMGGYAFYVWGSWGVSALAIIALIVFALLERAGAQARLRELEEDEG